MKFLMLLSVAATATGIYPPLPLTSIMPEMLSKHSLNSVREGWKTRPGQAGGGGQGGG